MNESPNAFHSISNPGFEDDDKPTSTESVQLKSFGIGHLDYDHRHPYETLNLKKAEPDQGSNRALLALVIIVCLISFVALLLTLLMLFGMISPSKKGQCIDLLMFFLQQNV